MAVHPICGYEDWPDAVRRAGPFAGSTAEVSALGRILGLRQRPAAAPPVHTISTQTVADVVVSELRWSVGYGPDTTGWLVRPVGATEPLPAVLGLHCHGGVRSVGGEQLVDLGAASRPRAAELRRRWYSGRAPANELARRGFAVLVHDTFSWGSRRFDLSSPTPRLADHLAAYAALWREQGRTPSTDEWFDLASSLHEDALAKVAGVLGQTFAGAVLTDDLVALDVLAARPDVDSTRIATFGFSGGGGRSLLLAALDARVNAYVVACMMATFSSLVPDYLDTHSWLLHIPGLWSYADWPDLTRLTTARLLVQYRRDDALFPIDGMQAAHARLSQLHAVTGRYQGSFFPGDHSVGPDMLAEAAAFMAGSRSPRDLDTHVAVASESAFDHRSDPGTRRR